MRRDLLTEAYRAGGSPAVAALVAFYLLVVACCVLLLGLAVYLLLWLVGISVAYWKACLIGLALNFIVGMLRGRR